MTVFFSFNFQNCRYKQAAEELSEQLQNKPFTPEEILVRHVENAVRFNVSSSLTSIASRQSFIEYYMLDLIIPLLALCSLLLVAICKAFLALTLFIVRMVTKFKSSKIKQQ